MCKSSPKKAKSLIFQVYFMMTLTKIKGGGILNRHSGSQGKSLIAKKDSSLKENPKISTIIIKKLWKNTKPLVYIKDLRKLNKTTKNVLRIYKTNSTPFMIPPTPPTPLNF
jgi:hypothetical protein